MNKKNKIPHKYKECIGNFKTIRAKNYPKKINLFLFQIILHGHIIFFFLIKKNETVKFDIYFYNLHRLSNEQHSITSFFLEEYILFVRFILASPHCILDLFNLLSFYLFFKKFK